MSANLTLEMASTTPSSKGHDTPEGTIVDGQAVDDVAVHVTGTDVEKGEVLDSGPPDGGLAAWIAIIGAACAGFCTVGFANTFGVFQAYYQDVIPSATPSTIAWIGSLQWCLIFLPGLVSGHLTDHGYFHLPFMIASVVLVAATFLAAECKTVWQLILCQGFAIGGSAGFIFLPALSIVTTWFNKKRGQAYGVVAVGSSVGGTVLPIALRKLLVEVGFKWTVRTLGFIFFALLIVANLTVKTRTKVLKSDGQAVPFRELMRNTPLMWYVAGLFTIWLGLYTPLTFLDVATQRLGIPASKSFYTIVAANAASGLGRLSSGYWADLFGHVNVLLLFTTLAGVMCIAWPFATSLAAVMVVAILYGFSSGAFISLLPSVVSFMVPRQQLGRAIGFGSSIMSFGALVGTPIAGQILTASGNFKDVGGWAGGTVFLAVGLFGISRRLTLGKWIGKA